MKKIVAIVIALALFPLAVSAAGGGGVPLLKAPVDLNDKGSLQRGAKYFVNFCQGCHSAEYMRYERAAADIGITDAAGNVLADLVNANLVFGVDRTLNDTMQSAMDKEQAAGWFGVVPPDLTLTARSRGADWIYSYLLGFYEDKSRPWGVNNVVFKDVGMPHVLLNLQGSVVKAADVDNSHVTFADLQVTAPGDLTAEEYKQMAADLVNFMVYMAEPAQQQRQRMGVWVLLFTALFLVFAYLLKREYWKDVK